MESCKGVHAHRRPLILGDIEKAIPLCGWPLEYKREKMGKNTPKPLKNLQKTWNFCQKCQKRHFPVND